MTSCTIIGISDAQEPWLCPEALREIAQARVFSGGLRHHDIVRHLLPSPHEWIDITVPVDGVFEEYRRHSHVVIFASGDPLFYGFGATVQHLCPEATMRVIPHFNSLQTLAHRLCLPYQEMFCTSLTGRPWDRFDEALLRGERLIGMLTDRRKTPHAIRRRMLDYGYTGYRLWVGCSLGNEGAERVEEYNPEAYYPVPNCMIAQLVEPRPRRFGIGDDEFMPLNGRLNMITKMPIRLATLAALDLPQRHCLWDVGFCTGSISIEARLLCPSLKVVAFERRSEGEELMRVNSRRFGALGIETVVADFLDTDLSPYERPDAVFIGGHGGRLPQMLARIKGVLRPGGVVVFNSVSAQSHEAFRLAAEALHMPCHEVHRITVDAHNEILILRTSLSEMP